LTDVDSAGINAMLLGFCQELRIDSVLTTQVINWARSSVRECDVARRLAFHAVEKHVLPKHVDERLVMLRDTRVHERGAGELDRLAREIKDPNYRIFVDAGQLHVISAGMHLQGIDPYALLARVQAESRRPLEASHAFYLGYELAKARTALTLGKDYRQDEALNWGFLTVAEDSHAGRRLQAASEESPVIEPKPEE
jgi:dihydropteroate synthase